MTMKVFTAPERKRCSNNKSILRKTLGALKVMQKYLPRWKAVTKNKNK